MSTDAGRADAALGLAEAEQVLAAQPFSRHLGARITAFGSGAATLELDLEEHLLQQHGFAHGGVLAYLADNAITFAAGTVLGPRVLTAGFGIDYLRPARRGPLRAHATVAAATGRQVVAHCEVAGPDGTCALAQGRVSAADR